jgi:hypothetical protein
MGCGASAVREQLPQAGPVGSAASLAKWKRTQKSQLKVVECSLPASIDPSKAVEKEAASEVDTNCGASSTDEAQSRPESRESNVSTRDSQLADNEMLCRQLRLQMSKACLSAAKSGQLAAALQQSREEPKSTTECIIAPPTAPPSAARFSRKKTTPSKASVAPAKAQDGSEVQKSETSSIDLDAIKKKTLASLEDLATDQEAFVGLLKSCKQEQAPNGNSNVDDLRKSLAATLQKSAEDGVLERMLEESMMEATSEPKDSKQVSQDPTMKSTSNDLDAIKQKAAKVLEEAVSSGTFAERVVAPTNNDVEKIRQKAARVLTNAVTSGTLENDMPSVLMTAKPKSDDAEDVRQKAVSALQKVFSSGSLDQAFPVASSSIDDKVVTGIRQRAAVSLFKAAQSGSLEGALSTMTVVDTARTCLEDALRNGRLDEGITNVVQKKTQSMPLNAEGKSNGEVEKIRLKAQASLEDFLRRSA